MRRRAEDLPPLDEPSASPFSVDPLESLAPDADPMMEGSLFRRCIGTPPSAAFPFLELERVTNDALVRLDRAKMFVSHLRKLSDLWLKVTTGRGLAADFSTAWNEFDQFSATVPWGAPFGWRGLLQPPHTDRFPAHPDGIRIGAQRFSNAHAAVGRVGPLIHDLWLAAHADLEIEVEENGEPPADPCPLIAAFFDRVEGTFPPSQPDDLLKSVICEYQGDRASLAASVRRGQDGTVQPGLRWSRGTNIADVIRIFGLRQKHALADLEKLRIPYTVISRERIHVGLHALDPEVRLQFEKDLGKPDTVPS